MRSMEKIQFTVIMSVTLAIAWGMPSGILCQAEEPVFSGPQVGETLPSFTVQRLPKESTKDGGLNEKGISQDCDPIADAGDGPVLVVFFHELTRPGFGLTRAIAKFAAERADQGLKSSVVFLTDDPTATQKWASNVRRHFVDGVTYAVSLEGDEGPGVYGLNRNVTLTVLVGKGGKVTGNFALIQPQLQVDGPKILQAIASVTGGGKIPDVAELEPRYAGRARMEQRRRSQSPTEGGGRAEQDPQLTSLLRSVINKQATAEQVQEAAAKVEAYVNENTSARKELARIVNTVVNSGKISSYGTEAAQAILKKWQATYPHHSTPPAKE